MEDFISPDMVIAEFNQSLYPEEKEAFVDEHNAGVDLLNIALKYRYVTDINAIKLMLDEINSLNKWYDYRAFVRARSGNRK